MVLNTNFLGKPYLTPVGDIHVRGLDKDSVAFWEKRITFGIQCGAMVNEGHFIP
jgi:hypothetical protein